MCPIEVSVVIGNTDNFTSAKMFCPRIKAWKHANHSSIKGTRRAKKIAKFKFTFYIYKCKLTFKWWQQPKCVYVELQWVMMGIQPQFQKMASSLQPGFVAGMVNSAHRQRFLENDAVISDSISFNSVLQFIDIVFLQIEVNLCPSSLLRNSPSLRC